MPPADADWGHAAALDDVSHRVAIVGVGEAEHTQASGRGAREISLEAVERALADAGLAPEDVDGLMTSGGMDDQLTPADYHAHFGTRHDLWLSGQGGGMAWAATAPQRAAAALARGDARVVLNVFAVSWATQRGSMRGGPGEFHARERLKARLKQPR